MSDRLPGNITQGPLAVHERFHAWVTAYGTTVAIKDSHNVTSVTKDATGDFTVTWAVPFSATAYAVVLGASRTDAAGLAGLGANLRSSTLPALGSVAIRFTQLSTSATRQDPEYFSVAAVGYP